MEELIVLSHALKEVNVKMRISCSNQILFSNIDLSDNLMLDTKELAVNGKTYLMEYYTEEKYIDPKTGLKNELGVRHTLESIDSRFDDRYLLCLGDIDHFKLINDTHSYQIGDEILVAYANLLKEYFKRKGDLIARFGGDEFIIALRGITIENGINLIEEFRKKIESHTFPHDIAITSSYGVIDYDPKSSYKANFSRVNDALKAAKTNFRNTVIYENKDKKHVRVRH